MNKPEPKKDFVLIAKIVGVHGVKGTLKIQSYAESLAIFKAGTILRAKSPEGIEEGCEIDWIKPHSRGALLALKNVVHRDQAKKLIGCDLFIKKAALPELEPGAFFWFDLIGIEVFSIDGRYLGRLDSIIETGANDVYVVTNDRGEILIPALESVVHDIDIAAKVMRVDLPDGLEDE